MVDPTVREQLLNPHKLWMLSTLGLSAGLAFWALAARPFPSRGRGVFVLLLLVMLAVMAHGADNGGRARVRLQRGRRRMRAAHRVHEVMTPCSLAAWPRGVHHDQDQARV
jgi:hypothetical protein